MKSIIFREIKSFFGSPVGYLVIAIFLILNGLFLWIFDGEYNILQSGFADMTPFFILAPWILLFLIPAVTMRSFSDEKKQGTIELLFTKPLSLWQIVLGKFFGAFLLIIISIAPTLIYVHVLSELTLTDTPIDTGSIMGSYFGLLFLVASYTAIGIFTSTLSENQIVAFILAVFFCFVFYFALESVASLNESFGIIISKLGMDYHYKSMARGVLDTRDIVYFLSFAYLFLLFTVTKLKALKY